MGEPLFSVDQRGDVRRRIACERHAGWHEVSCDACLAVATASMRAVEEYEQRRKTPAAAGEEGRS